MSELAVGLYRVINSGERKHDVPQPYGSKILGVGNSKGGRWNDTKYAGPRMAGDRLEHFLTLYETGRIPNVQRDNPCYKHGVHGGVHEEGYTYTGTGRGKPRPGGYCYSPSSEQRGIPISNAFWDPVLDEGAKGVPLYYHIEDQDRQNNVKKQFRNQSMKSELKIIKSIDDTPNRKYADKRFPRTDTLGVGRPVDEDPNQPFSNNRIQLGTTLKWESTTARLARTNPDADSLKLAL